MALRKSIIEYAESLEPDGYFTIEQLRDEMIAREGHGFRANSLLTLVEDMVYQRILTPLPGDKYCLRKESQEALDRVHALAKADMEKDPRYDFIRRDRERNRQQVIRLVEKGLIRRECLEDFESTVYFNSHTPDRVRLRG